MSASVEILTGRMEYQPIATLAVLEIVVKLVGDQYQIAFTK